MLEARDRVGGRIRNHTFADGTIVELGGQWDGPTQDRVLALADELGVGTFPSHELGDHLLGIDGGARRWADETFGLDHEALIDVAHTQSALEALAATVPLDAPWDAPNARALDAQTVECWLVANTRTETGLLFWQTLIPAIFSAEPDQMSLLHFLFYVHSGGMIDMLVAAQAAARRTAASSAGARRSRWCGGGARRRRAPRLPCAPDPPGAPTACRGGARARQRARGARHGRRCRRRSRLARARLQPRASAAGATGSRGSPAWRWARIVEAAGPVRRARSGARTGLSIGW